jgi:Zn-dependent protease with chaperone function
VGLALATLRNWRNLGGELRSPLHSGGLTKLIANFIGWLLVTSTTLYAALMLKLTLSQSRRAEYRADLLAARVVGTAQMVAGLVAAARHDKIAHVALPVHPGADTWQALRDQLALLPETERRRLELKARADTAPGSGIDTHPPRGHRIAVLEAHPADARIAVAPAEWRRAEAQIAPAARAIVEDLIAG